MTKQRKRICIDCGKSFIGYCNEKRCKDCKRDESYRRNQEYIKRMRLKKEKAERPQAKVSLDQIIKELEQYNRENGTHLSYGQYVAMKQEGADERTK
jgi:hypothetical protein